MHVEAAEETVKAEELSDGAEKGERRGPWVLYIVP